MGLFLKRISRRAFLLGALAVTLGRGLRPAGAIDEAIVSPRKKDPKPVPKPTPLPTQPVAPNVVNVTPVQNATGVAISTNVTATFDVDMTSGSITTSTFTLKDQALNSVTSTVSYSSGTRTATLNPNADLTASTTYTARLLVGITNSLGTPLAVEYAWSFTTVTPTPAPQVQSTNPTQNATNVPVANSITVTFDQAMTSGTITTGNLVLRDQAAATVTSVVTYDAPTRTATVNPNADLANSNTHTLTVGTGVQNSLGTALAAPYVLTFTTVATPLPAPTVTAVAPLAGSVDRAVTVNAKATFDVPMDAATITGTTMKLRNAAGNEVAGTVSYDSLLQQAIFNPTLDLTGGTTFTCTLTSGSAGMKNTAGTPLAADYSWSFTTVGSSALTAVGYASVASPAVTGGAGGQTFNVTDWASFRVALESTGARTINLLGSTDYNGGGAEFSLRDSDNQGNFTVNGSGFSGQVKNYKITHRCSNVIYTQARFRTGEGATAGDSADRRAITFLPAAGDTIHGVILDHCSFAFGPDVLASFLNNTEDVTVQYCILGPALMASNIVSSPNGFGVNITNTAAGGTAKRITYYRNLFIMNEKRTPKINDADGVDIVNNAIYDYGSRGANGNPAGANLVGNVFRKGPQTSSSEVWTSELTGGEAPSYFSSSIYFPTAGADRNIGFVAAGGTSPASFTLVTTFNGTGNPRGTAYDGGPGATTHGTVTVATPDMAMYNAVIDAAGPTNDDALDALIKGHALNGTSNGYYNGASTGTAPFPP